MSVTVYTKPACVQCNATYRALDKRGIEYQIVDVTGGPGADQGSGLPAGPGGHHRAGSLVRLPPG